METLKRGSPASSNPLDVRSHDLSARISPSGFRAQVSRSRARRLPEDDGVEDSGARMHRTFQPDSPAQR